MSLYFKVRVIFSANSAMKMEAGGNKLLRNAWNLYQRTRC